MKQKKWPKWLEIRYYDEASKGIMGLTICVNNSEMMMEVLFRYKLSEPSIIRWRVDEILLDSEGIKKIFTLYDKHRKEIEEKYEKRKTTIQETEGTDPGSKS